MAESTHGEPEFREVQYVREMPLAALSGVVMAVCVVVMCVLSAAHLRDHWADEAVPLDVSLLVVTGVLLVTLPLSTPLFLRGRLVTEVRGDALHIRYHWLFVRRQIPYSQIAQCWAREYRPLMEYGGWGVRWSLRHGKAYNVHGNRGVQLKLSNGKRLLIGSQEPDELAAAINARRGFHEPDS